MKKYILSLIALAFLPMAAWAQDEAVLVDIATAFPDDKLRGYINGFDNDGDGKLSEVEIAAIKLLDVKNMGIKKMDGIENLTAVEAIYCYCNELTSLDVTSLPNLEDLRCGDNTNNESNRISKLNVSQNSKLKVLYCYFQGLTELDVTNNLELEDLQCRGNALTSLDVSFNKNLKYLVCDENDLGELNVKNNTQLLDLQCQSCGLSELDVTNNKELFRLDCWDNNIKEIDLSQNTVLKTFRCSTNPIKELDLSKLTQLEVLSCFHCELTNLDVTNNALLENLECYGNQITTLDLSKNEILKYAAIDQSKVVDAIVIDREKIAIEVIPTNEGTVLSGDLFSNLSGSVANDGDKEYVEIDGKCYLVIAKPTDNKDVDLYGNEVKYKFNTQCPSEDQKDVLMSVTITTYPYIMNEHPNSKDLKESFYSGTLIVNYDAVVPEGAEAYIATGVILDAETFIMDGDKVTFDQLKMVKVGDAGDVIPAYTPIYVKAPEASGLYAFARNLEGKETVTIPSGNILRGTFTDRKVSPGEVLTLGRESKKGTGEVGFWAFLGTTVPAHRVFIDSEILEDLDDANGFTLNFDDAADGINTISTTTANGAYYTLQGIKVSEPTQKGIYIHNGKKFMVK